MLFVNDLPSVINVTTQLFANDVKMVSPLSQSDLLQRFPYNVWNWSVNWDLPIGLLHFDYPLPLEVRAILNRLQTLLNI